MSGTLKDDSTLKKTSPPSHVAGSIPGTLPCFLLFLAGISNEYGSEKRFLLPSECPIEPMTCHNSSASVAWGPGRPARGVHGCLTPHRGWTMGDCKCYMADVKHSSVNARSIRHRTQNGALLCADRPALKGGLAAQHCQARHDLLPGVRLERLWMLARRPAAFQEHRITCRRPLCRQPRARRSPLLWAQTQGQAAAGMHHAGRHTQGRIAAAFIGRNPPGGTSVRTSSAPASPRASAASSMASLASPASLAGFRFRMATTSAPSRASRSICPFRPATTCPAGRTLKLSSHAREDNTRSAVMEQTCCAPGGPRRRPHPLLS